MSKEAVELVQEMQKTFSEFKSANDERLTAIEKKKADVLLEEKVDRINSAVDSVQKKMDDVELATKRRSFGTASNDETIQSEEAIAYKAAFGAWARKGSGSEDELRALAAKVPEMKALSVGDNSAGGFLVTPQIDNSIIKRQRAMSPIRGIAGQITISTDALEGLYQGQDADANWVAETQTRSETTAPGFGKFRITTNELTALPQVSQKLLDDAVIDLEAYLAEVIADRFDRKEGNAFVLGDGVGKPRGFTTYTAVTTADDTRSWGNLQYVASGASGAFAATTPDNYLFDLIYALHPVYHANAKFVMNRTTQASVRKLKDTTGQSLWVPGLGVGLAPTLLGYPVVTADDMAAIAANSLSIAFGDFGQGYKIVDRLGVRLLRDPYTSKPNVIFASTKRVGGDVVDFNAIKLMKFSAS